MHCKNLFWISEHSISLISEHTNNSVWKIRNLTFLDINIYMHEYDINNDEIKIKKIK